MLPSKFKMFSTKGNMILIKDRHAPITCCPFCIFGEGNMILIKDRHQRFFLKLTNSFFFGEYDTYKGSTHVNVNILSETIEWGI